MPTIGTAERPAEAVRTSGSEPDSDGSREMLVDQMRPTDLVEFLTPAQSWAGSAASLVLAESSAESSALSRTSTVSSVLSSVVA